MQFNPRIQIVLSYHSLTYLTYVYMHTFLCPEKFLLEIHITELSLIRY